MSRTIQTFGCKAQLIAVRPGTRFKMHLKKVNDGFEKVEDGLEE